METVYLVLITTLCLKLGFYTLAVPTFGLTTPYRHRLCEQFLRHLTVILNFILAAESFLLMGDLSVMIYNVLHLSVLDLYPQYSLGICVSFLIILCVQALLLIEIIRCLYMFSMKRNWEGRNNLNMDSTELRKASLKGG